MSEDGIHQSSDNLSMNNTTIEKLGSYNHCVALIEKETKIPNFIKYIKVIDQHFGVTPVSSTDDLMRSAIKSDNRDIIVLSGYAHMLLAEQMYQQNYDIEDINKEISKAEALLDFANLGGNHPLLPRTMKLKRRVNWKSYTKLVLTCIFILIAIILLGLGYRYVDMNDIDFL
ncbi:hypothetical protein TRFO_08770 [Tritrichomonas foetus]|uniref:Uncharacterized protein n=1 Tax=Tritrichomonas foetus TaxID=1144522 RepID=A0A1J4JMJ2_9EUKA|nr:hypothetical protein TRFO_08770 [Tritrichomonas foetus]|eukprot:OHS98755.1 hypothetical protein TRFO_08770 [Tritrichomonas foetus]